jgi:hypothetical protein
MRKCLAKLLKITLIVLICLVILQLAPALLGTLILLWLITRLFS